MFSLFFIGQQIKSMQGGKIQVLLDSGSVALLTFKDGKFSSINNVKSTKPNYFLHASQCVNNQEMIVLEQKCEPEANSCDQYATLTRSKSKNTYEAKGDRGLVTKSWAFCDENELDAYQLLLASQDGSIVSVTPLGNIMWEREEGLAAIKTVQLISKSE